MDLLGRTLGPTDVHGDLVTMRRLHPRHFNAAGEMAEMFPRESSSFSSLIQQGLNKTSELALDSQKLMQRALVDPDSLNVHDVTLAMAKARMALGITKATIERAVKAYREITALR